MVHQGKYAKLDDFLFFWSMEKNVWDGPKWGREDVFLTNPELADILGRVDLDFDSFLCFGFLGPQHSRFPGARVPNFQILRLLEMT